MANLIGEWFKELPKPLLRLVPTVYTPCASVHAPAWEMVLTIACALVLMPHSAVDVSSAMNKEKPEDAWKLLKSKVKEPDLSVVFWYADQRVRACVVALMLGLGQLVFACRRRMT